MRVAVVVLLAMLIVGLTVGASGEQAGRTIRDSVIGQQVRLDLPVGDEKPKGLAIWFHGQGGNVNDRIDGPFFTELKRDGWAIASGDFHEQSWGNIASTSDTIALQHFAEAQVHLPVTLWVSGSMGGAISLNALIHGARAPACWYGVKPAISLHQMQHVPAAPRYLRIAYPDSVPPDRDTVHNVAKLPQGITYRVVASHGDMWVPFTQNAAPLIEGLRSIGADVSLLTASGPHEDPSEFNAPDLASFAASCLTKHPGIPDATSTTRSAADAAVSD